MFRDLIEYHVAMEMYLLILVLQISNYDQENPIEGLQIKHQTRKRRFR